MEIDSQGNRIFSNKDMLSAIQGQFQNDDLQAFKQWLGQSKRRQKRYEAYQKIHAQNSNLKGYENIDIEKAYAEWETTLHASQTSDANHRRVSTGQIYMWLFLVFILGLLWWMHRQHKSELALHHDDATGSWVSNEDPKSVQLPFGTVELSPFSTLSTVKNKLSQDINSYRLQGNGSFALDENLQTPTQIWLEDSSQLITNDASFNVMQYNGDSIKIVNKTGQLKIVNPQGDTTAIIGADSISHASIQLVETPTKTIHQEYNNTATSYTYIQVLDHLMKASNWKVISAPYMPFTPHEKINIDLNRDPDQLLSQLQSKGVLQYEALNCTNCYRITSFTAP